MLLVSIHSHTRLLVGHVISLHVKFLESHSPEPNAKHSWLSCYRYHQKRHSHRQRERIFKLDVEEKMVSPQRADHHHAQVGGAY